MVCFLSKVECLSSRGRTQRMESRLAPSVESADAFSSLCAQIRAILQSSTQLWFYSTQCSSSTMVWLPRRLPPSESSFYSSKPEKLCIFPMVVLLVLSRQYREMDYQNWIPQLLLSQKYKQLTNQLQFDNNASLTMNRCNSCQVKLTSHKYKRHGLPYNYPPDF